MSASVRSTAMHITPPPTRRALNTVFGVILARDQITWSKE